MVGNKENREHITEEYEEFWKLANKLADADIPEKEFIEGSLWEDNRDRHLISMIEMYSIRHGDAKDRRLVVNYLEKQLFRNLLEDGEVCHLTFDMWHHLKETVLKCERTGE